MNEPLPTKANAKEWLMNAWKTQNKIRLVHKVSSEVIFALSDAKEEIYKSLSDKEQRMSLISFTLDCGIGGNPDRK